MILKTGEKTKKLCKISTNRWKEVVNKENVKTSSSEINFTDISPLTLTNKEDFILELELPSGIKMRFK